MAGENTKISRSDVVETDDEMPDGFYTLWKRRQLLDYTVTVKGSRFKVHKIVLVSMSDYFRLMLTGTMAESQTDCVEVHGVSASVMDKLICFMYTSEMKLTKNTAADILAGAMYLQIPTAVTRCTDYMVSHISITNWYDVLSLFHMYNLIDAIQKARAFIKEQRMTKIVLTTNDLCELSLNSMHSMHFALNKAEGGPECNRVFLITQWVKADPKARKKHLKDLLDHVKYWHISPTELAAIKSTKMDRRCQSDLQELVKKGLAYHELPIHQKVVYNSKLSKVPGKTALVSFSKTAEDVGSYFELTVGVYTQLVADEALKMPEDVMHVDEETVINNFFVICATVGNVPEHAVQQWYIFDPLTKQWSQMANLERLFHRGSLANDGEYLYAIGGLLAFPATEATSTSIDRYDFRTNTWSAFAELRFTGTEHSACILDNKLYVSGGRMNNQPKLATMDCLDLSTQTWEMKPPMFEALSDHTMHIMTVEGEKVISIFNDSFFVEYYSPKADKWHAGSFTFSDPVPKKGEVGMFWAEGNTIYLVDINLQEAFGEAGMAYHQLQFPEKGDKVNVCTVKQYQMPLINSGKVHSTMLRLPIAST